MLLEFKMQNFKSFKELMEFKMIPAQKIKDLEYSLIKRDIAGKEIKALSSSVIYGPNSSGKTNLIGGMEVFRAIVLSGNIKNSEVVTNSNIAANKLELIPNINSTEDEPVYFYIKFVVENMLIELSLKFKVGRFLQDNYERKIIEEELIINNNTIYTRGETLNIGNIKQIQEQGYLIENFSEDIVEKIAQSNLDSQELFLNGMFKTLYSKKIYDMIIDWFTNHFRIMYHFDKMHFSPKIPVEKTSKKYYADKTLNKAVKNFGLTSEKIVYPITENKEQIKPMSVIGINNKKEGAIIPAEFFESFGTIRFLDIFPMLLTAMRKGTTLVVDELDASIHPMAIMNIINIFHNDDINKKGAQLIFNTHNPIFLNSNLLRRDEIKFVEKEKEKSKHYSLSDFGTSGKNGVRNGEDYMKNYFINKYGAIRNVDFSEVFEEYMNK